MDIFSFLNAIVKEITGTEPTITHATDDEGLTVHIEAKENVGRLIGKEGRTIEAIRTLVKAVGHEGSHAIRVKVNENTRED